VQKRSQQAEKGKKRGSKKQKNAREREGSLVECCADGEKGELSGWWVGGWLVQEEALIKMIHTRRGPIRVPTLRFFPSHNRRLRTLMQRAHFHEIAPDLDLEPS